MLLLPENGRNGELPPNSADLNPIENAFGLMKQFVRKLAPSTEEELKKSIQATWDSIKVETLNNLFESMPRRIQSVIQAKGNRINY